MSSFGVRGCVMWLVGLWLSLPFLTRGSEIAPIDFAGQIAPLLETHCLRCHNPGNEQGGLSLADFADLQANEYVTAGDPDSSYLLDVVTSSEPGAAPVMPKEGEPLNADQRALLQRWIEQGAAWPEGLVLREKSRADRQWWSLQPLSAAEPPKPADWVAAWSAHPIDLFVGAKLDEKGLRPNPPADKRSLIRRATYDLTGLPPTPEEVAEFLADDAPDAYERLLDRLLASERYGEQWGRHWLDVVRYGESNGYERNILIENVWPFRDYVIRSFNEDKPFDRLVLEHLAGDQIGAGDPQVEVGTTFLVCGPYDNVGNQDAVQSAQIRADTIDEIIRAAGEAFLGLTVGCARCHDHKFDPLTQRDYYGWYATFAGVKHGARPAPISDKPPMWWMGQFEPAEGPFHVFLGGDPQRHGETVEPASLTALDSACQPYRLADEKREAERRLALAQWIVQADNPLTPRVLANRLWHYHFGAGIVDTPNDFGFMGGRPTHPELLDWLARCIQQDGWRLKPLHKRIMNSQAYRQSAEYRIEAATVDADSRLLWRFPPRRLAAEEIWDTLLLIAGKLDERMGGPGFQLYRYVQDNVATYTPLDEFGPETYRRAVYHQKARASLIDLVSDFDGPDCAFSAPRRAVTTTPLQALTMMNHRFTTDIAGALADRLQAEAGNDSACQVRRAFEWAYGRPPNPEELSACVELTRAHGLSAFCRALLNTSELIYLY